MVAKIRSRFWVTNLIKSMKSIRHIYIRCKIEYQKLEYQSTGKLPVELLIPN